MKSAITQLVYGPGWMQRRAEVTLNGVQLDVRYLVKMFHRSMIQSIEGHDAAFIARHESEIIDILDA